MTKDKPIPAWTLAQAAQLAKKLKLCPACGSYSPINAETCDEVLWTGWGPVVCGYSFSCRQ